MCQMLIKTVFLLFFVNKKESAKIRWSHNNKKEHKKDTKKTLFRNYPVSTGFVTPLKKCKNIGKPPGGYLGIMRNMCHFAHYVFNHVVHYVHHVCVTYLIMCYIIIIMLFIIIHHHLCHLSHLSHLSHDYLKSGYRHSINNL